MITEIRANNFRSLTNFVLKPRLGLNILVGPNGSGKSNFVALLDFISDCLNHGLTKAVANAGGVRQTFSQESRTTSYKPKLSIHVEGEFESEWLKQIKLSNTTLNPISYSYFLEVAYSKKFAQVYISKEILKIHFHGSRDLIIERKTSLIKGTIRESINITPKNHEFNKSVNRYYRRDGDDIGATLVRYISRDTSIFNSPASEISSLPFIGSDISKHRSVNINPASVRQANSIADEGYILSDGSGLPLALYRMGQSKYRPNYFSGMWTGVYDEHFFNPEYYTKLRKSIVNWCTEIDPSIKDIGSEAILESGLVYAYVNYCYGDNERRIDFSSISDGTAKWIALVTIMLASPNYSVFEEPENFLHPRMQEVFIALSRMSVSKAKYRSQLFITTHSESILDKCEVNELIIFFIEEGVSRSSYPRNRDELNKVLEKSRFGLGHYYSIGAIVV